MTLQGGQHDNGVIFKCDLDGSNYAILHDFDSSVEGAYPKGNLTLLGNKLYGMTSSGGANGGGVLFSYDLTLNINKPYAILYEFGASNNDGISPSGSLTLASDGKLYGTTSAGGDTNDGTIFSYNPSDDTYFKKYSFELNTTGNAPLGNLTELNDKLYGMNSGGGSQLQGTIFEYDFGFSQITQVFNFGQVNNIADGSTPQGSLTLSNGTLYGMTSTGGSNNNFGVIFSFNPKVGYTHLIDFDPSENFPSGSLTIDGSQLYGMTSAGGTSGTLFSYDLANPGSITNLENFKDSNGASPLGSVIEFNNIFYGMTQQGGSKNGGVIFSYDPAAGTPYSILHEFDSSNNTQGRFPDGDLTVVDDAVLPVSLTSFTAKVENNEVEIEWATASEQNNSHFIIERSIDGTKFDKMGTNIEGHGTTSAPQRYSTYDHNPENGVNYYRLIQVDLNGQAADKGTKAVKFNLGHAFVASLQVSPNPVTNVIKFKLGNYTGKEVKAVLTTMSGKILHKQTLEVREGIENTLNFKPVSGSYLLRINGEGGLNLSNVVLVQ